MARIPGVVVTGGVVDVAGLTGIGLSLDNPVSGMLYEWVLNEATSTILGANTYLLGDSARGPSGLRTNAEAVLSR